MFNTSLQSILEKRNKRLKAITTLKQGLEEDNKALALKSSELTKEKLKIEADLAQIDEVTTENNNLVSNISDLFKKKA